MSGRAIEVKDGYAELPKWPGLGLQRNVEVAKKYPPPAPNPQVYFEDGSVADY